MESGTRLQLFDGDAADRIGSQQIHAVTAIEMSDLLVLVIIEPIAAEPARTPLVTIESEDPSCLANGIVREHRREDHARRVLISSPLCEILPSEKHTHDVGFGSSRSDVAIDGFCSQKICDHGDRISLQRLSTTEPLLALTAGVGRDVVRMALQEHLKRLDADIGRGRPRKSDDQTAGVIDVLVQRSSKCCENLCLA